MRARPLFVMFAALLLAAVVGRAQSPFAAQLPAATQNKQATFQPPPNKPKYAPDRLLVRFRPGTPKFRTEAAHVAVRAQVVRSFKAVRDLQLVRLPEGVAVEAALNTYRNDPAVLYAEPDYAVHVLQNPVTPNDPLFAQQWALHNIGQNGGVPGADIRGPEAWSLSTGSPNVVVGVIDTGIDYNHEDLNANMFRNSLDCNSNGIDDDGNGFIDDCYGIDTANGDSDPMDDHGHGTHVAGIIGAAGNNGIGVVGVNWHVKLLACKFINSAGWGYESDAITCLDYMAATKDRGVNIVATNNSWGGDSFSQALLDAIDLHRQRGILFIAAAGNAANDNDGSPLFPAGYYLPNIIAVAATDNSDLQASFSSFGRHSVHLGAPGVDILSTVPPGLFGSSYLSASGTSMAAPHVTGVAALLAAQDPTRDWKTIRNLILTGGDSIPALAQTISGKRLNAYGAMTCKDSIILSRLQPRTTITTAAVGLPVDLAVLHINCGSPNGVVSVSLDGGIEVIPLLDDGLGADQEVGDGMYSGQWTPSATGSHTLAFPGGDIVTVQVLSPYRFSTATFAWRTITGTPLKLNDMGSGPEFAAVSPPFPIRFGGGSFDSLHVNSNGNITFTAPFPNPIVEPIPSPGTSTLVAPFWDDLALFQVNDNSTPPADAYWEALGAAPNRELVIEWRDVSHVRPSCSGFCVCDGRITFQVVFFEGRSDMLFNYADVVFADPTQRCGAFNQGRYAAVGVQVTPRVGTQFSYASPSLADGFAVLWEIGNAAPALAQLSPFTALTTDSTLSVKVLGSNFVPGAVVRWNGADLPTTFVNSSELRAAVSAADLSTPGKVQVSVFNPGGGLSNQLPFDVYASHPVPSVTGVSQPVLTAGSPGPLTMYVYGSQFVTSSVVRWNGSARSTTAFDSTRLTAEIPASDYAAASTVEVTVFNPGPGGGTSNAVTVQIVNPVPSLFSLWPVFAAVGSPDFTLIISSWPPSFVPVSVVRWNGSDRPTTFVSRGEVHAAISASDVATVGTATVTVINPAPGGGISNPLTFDIVARPPNDNFANAIEALPLPFTYVVDDRGATTESSDPIPSCSDDENGTLSRKGTVWYKYTPSRDIDLVAIARHETNSFEVLSVWVGTPGSLVERVCGSSYWQDLQSAVVRFTATAGTTFYFMLSQMESHYYPELALTFILAEVNPVPTIDSLSPLSAVAGGPAFTLTINGSGFVPNSVVLWNGLGQTTTVISNTKLTASIAAGLIAREGTAQVTVVNPSPGGGTSQALPFTITAAPQFSLAVSLTGSGTGTVTSNPAGINCGTTCSASFTSGTVVALSATPASGSTFAGWSGDCSGTGICSVTMTAAKNVTVTFDAVPPFDFGAPPASKTITAGQSAQFTLEMVGQPSFAGTVSFSCTSGVPQGAACSFNPPSVSPGGSTATTTLTVATTSRSTAALPQSSAAVFACMLMPLWLLLVPLARRSTRHISLAGIGILFVVIGVMAACGGGSAAISNPPNPSGTPAGTYTITISGASGSISRTQNVTLVVN